MSNRDAEWKSRGKTIAGLIRELQSFEDQSLEVRISVDDGDTSLPISLIGKLDGRCVLMNCQSEPTPLRHRRDA
jgi:hypothetical protein